MTDDRRKQRIESSVTQMVKSVLPSTTNNKDTLFGGTLLSWMDEVAFITATRFARCPFVTVSIDRTDFKQPIPSGSIVELVGRVEHVGRSSVKVHVDVFVEGMYSDTRLKAVTGLFTMVAIDDNSQSRPLPF